MGKGGVKLLEIQFQPLSNNTFYAGNRVAGNVVVELVEPLKIKAVKIKFLGVSSTSFPDAKKYTKTHSDKDQYIDESQIIFGGGSLNASLNCSAASAASSSENPVLEPGRHQFPFQLQLPASLPTSFESKHGHVRYTAKAYLQRPWKFDHTTKKAFTVVSLVDLNHEPLAFTPGIGRTEQRFTLSERLLKCVKGGLAVQIKIDRSAFVPGEAIPLNAEVLNNSSKRVKKVEAFLQQNLVCVARTGSRFFPGSEQIGLVSHGPVDVGGALVWIREPLTLPALPPTKLGGCRILSVDYMLKFNVFLESGKEIRLSMPIVIGTIPLHRGTIPWLQRPPPASNPNLSSTTPVNPSGVVLSPNGAPTNSTAVAPLRRPESIPSAPPMDDEEMYLGPPPSYEECVLIEQVGIRDSEDDQDTQGDETYRPCYPLYPTLGHPPRA